jgi:hypothetical protein
MHHRTKPTAVSPVAVEETEHSTNSLASFCSKLRKPLWSSGQSFWLQIQRSQVLFPPLQDFQRSRGSGTGSTQPREDN